MQVLISADAATLEHQGDRGYFRKTASEAQELSCEVGRNFDPEFKPIELRALEKTPLCGVCSLVAPS